jgi:hypothetical protein
MILRRLFALSALAAVVGALSACGGGTSVTAETLTPGQLAQAASASAEEQSSRFALDFRMTFPGAPETFAFSGEGAFDTGNERATMSLDLSSLAGLIGGLGRLDPGQDAPDLSDPDGWKIDAIVDGKVVYMRFPAFADELPERKTWVKVGATKDAPQGFGGFSGLEGFADQDPRELLEVLESVTGEIETVGTEELRGTATTHYRATLDLRDLGALTPQGNDQGQDFGQVFDQLFEQTGFSDVPFDVWLDGDGLVRKVQASFSMAPPGEQEKLEASFSFELYDYGVAVDVTPPPADEVVDASALSG